ncbi:hypothetical protein ACSBR1_006558 [Camellia fascicularis]
MVSVNNGKNVKRRESHADAQLRLSFAVEITERKKLVSSMKSSITHSENQVTSDVEKNNSFPYTNSNSSCINDKRNGHVFSGSYAHSTADEAPHVLSIAAIRGYYEGEKNRVAELTVEKDHLAMPFPKEFEENGSVIDLPKTLPSSFPKASEIDDPIEERIQELTEESLEVGSDEGHDPGDEDTTPPPLAGANVMNIILVAAECAPWSKTGGLGDVARALPKALARRGHRVMVVAPKYGDYAELQIQGYTRSIRWMGRMLM